MTQINTDANSIIKAGSTYSSNQIIALDSTNEYLRQINNWTNGTWNNTSTIISRLLDILAELRLQNAR
jgi:hypothetical protein